MIATQDRKKIAIIGAGISGLSLAWYLKKKYREKIALQIFEARERAGGWIRSSMSQGHLFEYGPRAFRAADSEAAYSLVQELGLENFIRWAETEKRHLLYKKRIEPVPQSIKEWCFSPLTTGCTKEIISDLFYPNKTEKDISVEQFFLERFGPNIVSRFVNPFISGIYAGDPKKLSLKQCFPNLVGIRSLLLNALFAKKTLKKGLWSLSGGLETLIGALVKKIEVDLFLNRPVHAIKVNENCAIVKDSMGFHVFDHLFSTLSLPQLKPLINCSLPELPYTSVIVVHLGFSSQITYPKSFGYLVPESEGEQILGVVFDSAIFTQQEGKTCFTVMMGGEKNRKLLEMSDDQLIEIAKKALNEHLAITQPPEICTVFRAKESIPQFPVGYQKAQDFPTLSFLGTSFSGVSLNQLISAAKAKVDAVELFKNAAWHQNCVYT